MKFINNIIPFMLNKSDASFILFGNVDPDRLQKWIDLRNGKGEKVYPIKPVRIHDRGNPMFLLQDIIKTIEIIQSNNK